jgi:signal peptidase I
VSDIAVIPAAKTPRRARGWLAALISLVVPGLGQLYVGRWRSALLLMLVGQTLYPLMAVLIVVDALSFWSFMLCMMGSIAIQLGGAIHAFLLCRWTVSFQPLWWSRWYGLVTAAVLYFAIGMGGAFLYEDPIKSFNIPANSMQPNLPEGDRLVAVGLYGKPVERGEIVIFQSTATGGADYVKRVVALAGDTIELRDKRLLVNDREVSGPPAGPMQLHGATYDLTPETIGERRYTVLLRRDSDPRMDNFARQRVPARHVFVLGDNRSNSHDSRFLGPVKIEDIHWRAAFVFWSHDLERIGLDLRTNH